MRRAIFSILLGLGLLFASTAVAPPTAKADDSFCAPSEVRSSNNSTEPIHVASGSGGSGSRDWVDPGKSSSIKVGSFSVPWWARVTITGPYGSIVYTGTGTSGARWVDKPFGGGVCQAIWIRPKPGV